MFDDHEQLMYNTDMVVTYQRDTNNNPFEWPLALPALSRVNVTGRGHSKGFLYYGGNYRYGV